MYENVLKVELMVAAGQVDSFWPARQGYPKNCATRAETFRYLVKPLLILEKQGINHNLNPGLSKGYFISPGIIRVELNPLKKTTFDIPIVEDRGFAQLLGFTRFTGCGKNNSKLGLTGGVNPAGKSLLFSVQLKRRPVKRFWRYTGSPSGGSLSQLPLRSKNLAFP